MEGNKEVLSLHAWDEYGGNSLENHGHTFKVSSLLANIAKAKEITPSRSSGSVWLYVSGNARHSNVSSLADIYKLRRPGVDRQDRASRESVWDSHQSHA